MDLNVRSRSVTYGQSTCAKAGIPSPHLLISPSPHLLISPSPHLLISPSPHLSISPKRPYSQFIHNLNV